MDTKLFIYRDPDGKVTVRKVDITFEDDECLKGHCRFSAGQNRRHTFRTFRKDGILETVEIEEIVFARRDAHKKDNPEPPPPEEVRRYNPEGKPEICFTGFKKEEKAKLKNLANQKGFYVRTRVTRYLDFLCCGDNAGPKKKEKALQQEVEILTKDVFLSIRNAGELNYQEREVE